MADISEDQTLANAKKRIEEHCFKVCEKNATEIMQEYINLSVDYEHVKDMNTVISNTYDQIRSSYPTVAELQTLLDSLDLLCYSPEIEEQRKAKLRYFQSILKRLEINDPRVCIKPYSSEELQKNEE